MYDPIKRLALFPNTTQIVDQRLQIDGQPLDALAAEFGTPLYVFDRATLDDAVTQYRRSLQAHYPGPGGLTYAGKAYLSLAMAQWAGEQGLWVDCTGAGEIAVAAAAGVPRSRLLVHGVNKSRGDLQAALQQAGTIVVDNPAELERIIELSGAAAADPAAAAEARAGLPQLWLRLRPGLAVDTHAYTQTGQDDSKFGMSAAEIMQAAGRCLALGLPLSGLHFHQGSHFHDPAPLGPAIDTALDLVAELRSSTGWTPAALCPGGGWGVPYHDDDLPHQPVDSYVQFAAQHVAQGCAERGLPLPRLHFEPGRSLVARAGVALYRVEAVKRTPHRRWLLLDGGMADNPRPALYGARYSALPVSRPGRPGAGPAYLGGPFCESGDILIHDLELPEMEPGELLAVPVSGAYHLSMGSNYNGARKPAVLWLDGGQAHPIQRRETIDDLLRRDAGLPGRS
ncbi:MAG: diaminopimelate decarboxylase [Chloroflexota bacterium]